MHIEQWMLRLDHRWMMREYSEPAEMIPLSSIGVDLQLADIYEKIDFTK